MDPLLDCARAHCHRGRDRGVTAARVRHLHRDAGLLGLALLALAPAAVAHAAEVPGRTLDGPSAAIKYCSGREPGGRRDGRGGLPQGGPTRTAGSGVRRPPCGGAWGAPVKVSNSLNDVSDVEVEASNGGRLLVVYRTAVNELRRAGLARHRPAVRRGDPARHRHHRVQLRRQRRGRGLRRRHQGHQPRRLARDGQHGDAPPSRCSTRAARATVSSRSTARATRSSPMTRDDGGGDTRSSLVVITGTHLRPGDRGNGPDTPRPRRALRARRTWDIVSDLAGNAWVSFREQFAYTGINDRNRPLVRRLSGNAFGPAMLVDSGPTPPPDMTDAEFIRLAVAPNGANALASGFIQNNNTNKPSLFGASLTPGGPRPSRSSPRPSDGPITSGNGHRERRLRLHRLLVPAAARPPTTSCARGCAPAPAPSAPRSRCPTRLSATSTAPSPRSPPPTLRRPASSPTSRARRRQRASSPPRSTSRSRPQGAAVAATRPTPRSPGFSLSRTTFRKGTKLPKLSAEFKTGTTIRFRLSEAATVRLTFEKAARGRKVGKRAASPPARTARASAARATCG